MSDVKNEPEVKLRAPIYCTKHRKLPESRLTSQRPSRYRLRCLDNPRGRGQARAMPRQVRIEYPAAVYHVMSRGNRRQDIYLDDVERATNSRLLVSFSNGAESGFLECT